MNAIVVGVDGSPDGVAALRWAAEEARLRGAPLRLVHAYQAPRLAYGDGLAAPGMYQPALAPGDIEQVAEAAGAEARGVIESTLAQVDAEGLEVTQDAIEGPAASVLIEAGRGAALLVVGSRGRGGFAGLLLGSVSQQCAQHPPCPVVILPPVS